MMSKKNRTRQQMEEEMRQLRKVFMTVRLMKADEVQGGKKGSAPCYAQWRRSRPCENCVARQALEKNTRKTRLEYFGQELYEITASWVQVDGQLCVLELTRKIDRSVLLDPENGERLLNSITDEREKRYRDPLTGAPAPISDEQRAETGVDYDPDADTAYQQYKSQYAQKAKLANQNAQANASAMTGGYGSSYGTQAGQKAYAATMDDLDSVLDGLAAQNRAGTPIRSAWSAMRCTTA